MRFEFVVILFVLFLSGCKCGLLNWFDKWNKELQSRNADTKCRERRDDGENKITNSLSGGTVSLADIEDGKSQSETDHPHKSATSKTKRCPKSYFGRPFGSSILGQARPKLNPLSLVKRELDEENYEMCLKCLGQATCRILRKCNDCQKYCPFTLTFQNDQDTGLPNSKKLHLLGNFSTGIEKQLICRIIGIKNSDDIDSITVWATTFSNQKLSEPAKSHLFDSYEENRVEMPLGSDKARQSMNNQIKPRFNDYDSGEDAAFSKLRNIEEVKENPNLIEGPPPFLKSSPPEEKSLPLAEKPEILNNDQSGIVGSPNSDIIVQPKEFQADESDESEFSTQKITSKPIEPLSQKSTSLLNKLKSISGPNEAADAKPTGKKGLSEISKALQEVKEIVKNIQEEAQKSSEQRLLGSPRAQDDSHPATHLVNSALPSHVKDNFKDVNQYFIQRAQDALDTVGAPQNEQENLVNTDNHSAATKKIITDLKKVPEFVLGKFRDTLNGFDKSLKPNTESLILGETEPTNLSKKFGEIPTSNESIVGASKVSDANIETPTTKSYKSKVEKYLAELKQRRQNMYSPKKSLNTLPSKENHIESRLSKKKGFADPTETVPENEAETEKPKEQLTVTLPFDYQKQKELLRSKLKNYTEKVLLKKSSTTLKPLFGTEPGIPFDEIPQTEADNTELLRTPLNDINSNNLQSTNNNLPENVEMSEPIQLTTYNPNEVVGESQLLPKASSTVLPAFLPTVPSFSAEKTNPLNKYLENLRANALLSTPTPLAGLIEKNTIPEIDNFNKKIILKNKMKEYLKNLNKPSNELTPRMNNAENSIGNEQLLDKLKTAVINPKKDILKEKLNSYLNSLNKPRLSDLQSRSSDLMRKSSENQMNELGRLKTKLDNLVKEQINKSFSLKQANPIIKNSEPSNKEKNQLEDELTKEADNRENAALEPAEDKVGASNPLMDLQNRNTFPKEDAVEDFSHSLGKIVQSSSKPGDVFFMGNGIKLPMKMQRKEDGTIDFSVDIEKLCSCQNSTCPKNHTAIEETVGAILEKEAQLEDQLKNPADSSATGQSIIAKRSPAIDAYKLEDKIALPESTILEHKKVATTTTQKIANDLTNFSDKVQKSFSNSLNNMEDNMQKINKDVVQTLDANLKPLKKAVVNQNNNQKIKNDIDKLLKSNKLNFLNNNPMLDAEHVIKKLEQEKIMNKLLQQLNVNNILPPETALKLAQNNAKLLLDKNQLENNIKKIITNNENGLSKFQIPNNPKLPNQFTTNNDLLRNIIPSVPQVSDVYQSYKISALQDKLKELNSEVEKYEEDNENMLIEESKKIFGGRRNKVVENEVSIIGKMLSWLSDLYNSSINK